MDAIENRKVSSHSLGFEMLSHFAKRGVDVSDRLLLGYHASLFTMGLTYCRDGMARPSQVLSNMLDEYARHFQTGLHLEWMTCWKANKTRAIVPASRDDAVKVESRDDELDLDAGDLIPMSQQCSLPLETPAKCENEVDAACTEKRPAVSSLIMAAMS